MYVYERLVEIDDSFDPPIINVKKILSKTLIVKDRDRIKQLEDEILDLKNRIGVIESAR